MSPAPLLLLGCPSLEGAPGPPSQQLRDLGQVSSPLVSPSPLCNGTAGFLGGTVEDSVSRGPPVLLAPTLPWPARCPQGGFQEDRKAQLPRSHASRKSGNQKPRLPEAPSGGLVGPDTLWGTPLVPVWSPGRAVGWGEETGWSEPCLSWGLGWLPQNLGTPRPRALRTVALTGKSGPQPPGWFKSTEASGRGAGVP